MKKISNIYIVMALLGGTLTSCHKDLDLKPTNDITADVVYTTPQGYKQSLAKVYSSFALTGGGGTSATIGDIGGIDQGTSDFLRLYWNIQELASDEALCAWQDPGIPELNFMTWNSNNVLLQG
ncbi:MAG: RagB/SusD family nutrient uptake outer membrane protein, partial [Sphingobacterium sp.]